MTAMILAAGRGERMRPLTDTTPKPLLLVKEKALIVWHIEKLVSVGFTTIIINICIWIIVNCSCISTTFNIFLTTSQHHY